MPAFDGTGPTGQGARTGGGFGYCPPVGERENRGNIIYGGGRGGIPRGGGRGFASSVVVVSVDKDVDVDTDLLNMFKCQSSVRFQRSKKSYCSKSNQTLFNMN